MGEYLEGNYIKNEKMKSKSFSCEHLWSDHSNDYALKVCEICGKVEVKEEYW